MLFGTICALSSSVCFGTASVLQALGARAATPGAEGEEGEETGSDALRWSMPATAFGVLGLGMVAGPLSDRPRALALGLGLGLGAGFGFGVVEVAVRLIDGPDLANPAWYALLVGGGRRSCC